MEYIYFDLEIGYKNPEDAEKLRSGIKIPIDPSRCKIITIQYQILGEDGNPKRPLQIFREWESSEEKIIRKAFSLINPSSIWEFIPIGHNLYFDLMMFKERAKLYDINLTEKFIYHDLPTIDIKAILVGMNNFRLKGSRLDLFTGKESTGINVPIWYYNKEYDKIINYIRQEAEEFVKFYAKLKKALPELREKHGFY